MRGLASGKCKGPEGVDGSCGYIWVRIVVRIHVGKELGGRG